MAEAKSRSNLATSMKLSFPLMVWASTGVVSGTLDAQEASAQEKTTITALKNILNRFALYFDSMAKNEYYLSILINWNYHNNTRIDFTIQLSFSEYF